MIENLAIGCATIVACMIIQCVFVGVLVAILLHLEKKRFLKRTFAGLSALLLFTMITMFAGNLLQMALWAALFVAFGEFQTFDAAFYHSVVNFTSLGYGDVVMGEERRLLGALEAANGVMMFGLITAFLFAIIYELMQEVWDTRIGRA
ncbi:Ion channel [Planctomycetes bacterium CA13]|uniref:Ion channel n=1 Tax=Novipirellula herctigrandis TaxID=2527986 RepID=A0A5C5Z370_9BACT|nr:Ion channel [Planctomycetes bacterium CA13]